MELLRCAEWRQDVATAAGPSINVPLAPEQQARLQQLRSEAQKRADLLRPVCEGVQAGGERDAWKLIFQAAQNGHVPSMTKFGLRIGFFEGANAEFDLERFALYRLHAYDLLTRAAAAGDARAYMVLGTRLLIPPGSGTRAIPFDPARGIAYLKALERNGDADTRITAAGNIRNSLRNAGAKIDAAEELRAETLVAELERPLKSRAPISLGSVDAEMKAPGFGCGPEASAPQ